MKSIKIKRLELRNFKGIKELDIDFNDKETFVNGRNATGKTSIVDAFTWLLFDKDSKGRSQFDIKTIENGEVLHGLEHSVVGEFVINENPLTLKKIYKEKWVKKRGEEESELKGHTTDYFINDVPKRMRDYEDYIDSLVTENIFKLITNPLEFGLNLHWEKARQILLKVSDSDIDIDKLIDRDNDLEELREELQIKSIEEYQEQLKYQIRETNKKTKELPIAINVLHETIQDIDESLLIKKIDSKENSIYEIINQITDRSKLNEERISKEEEIYICNREMKELERKANESKEEPLIELNRLLDKKEIELRNEEENLELIKDTNKKLSLNIKETDKEILENKNKYNNLQKKEMKVDKNIKSCPTCKRDFPEEQVEEEIEEMRKNFNETKVATLRKILEVYEELQELKNELEEKHKVGIEKEEELKRHIDEIKNNIDEINKEIEGVKLNTGVIDMSKDVEYKALEKKRELFVSQLDKLDKADTSDLEDKKQILEKELKELEEDKYQIKINDKNKEKIRKLEKEEKELVEKLNEYQRKQYLLEKLVELQSIELEESINEHFEYVNFKLFNKQINGALEETCEALIKGVPFASANTASQVNGGIDIINTLCNHFDIEAPIFIDNREGVLDLIETDSQVINLVVTEDKELVIN